jgi:hypothetical protein
VAQDIFDAIVQQAIAKGLVDGTIPTPTRRT